MKGLSKLPKAQWTENDRRDGLTVRQGNGGWIIGTADGKFCAACPCCGALLATEHQARAAADFLYPMASE